MKNCSRKCKVEGCNLPIYELEVFCPKHRVLQKQQNKKKWNINNRTTDNTVGKTMYCKFCEKPLIRKTGSQKYHDECKEPAARAIELAHRANPKPYTQYSTGQGIACLKSRKGQAGIDARIELLYCASQKEGYDPKHPERTLEKMLE